jgi:hypothetical protein
MRLSAVKGCIYMNIIYYIQIHENEIILINLENRLQHVTSRSRYGITNRTLF